MSTEEKSVTLTPENMTIYEAIDLHNLFLSALGDFDLIDVDLSEVAEIDCTGLQLLLSFRNDAIEQKKTVTFVEQSAEVMNFLDLLSMRDLFNEPVIHG